MVISILAIFIVIALLFLLSIEVFLASAIYLYALLILMRAYKKNVNYLDVGVLLVYLFIGVLYFGFGFEQVIPYTGSIFYGALTIACFAGSIFGRPFTLSNIKQSSDEEIHYHRVMNLVMGVFYLGALFLSIFLFPSMMYIVMPLVLTAISIPGSIWLSRGILFLSQLRTEYHSYRNPDSFQLLDDLFGDHLGGFTIGERFAVKEVVTDQNRDLFFDTLFRNYTGIYQRSELKDKITYEQFSDSIKEEFQKYADQSCAFVVIDRVTCKGVGTIRAVWSDILPLEHYNPISLERLRKVPVKMAEIGRFSISMEGQEKSHILKVLLKTLFARLYLEGIELLLSVGTQEACFLYQKAGFKLMKKSFLDTEIGQPVNLCWFNLAFYSLRDKLPKKSFEQMAKTPWARLFLLVYRLRISLKHFGKRAKLYRHADVSPWITVVEDLERTEVHS